MSEDEDYSTPSGSTVTTDLLREELKVVAEERKRVGTCLTTTIGDYKAIVVVTVKRTGTSENELEVREGVETDKTLDEESKDPAEGTLAHVRALFEYKTCTACVR